MLDKVFVRYQKIRHGLISGLSETNDSIYSETSFYDQGFMQVQVSRTQSRLKSIDELLSNGIQEENPSSNRDSYLSDLVSEREMLLFHLVFLLSNSFSNLDICKTISNNHNFKFISCINGLECYMKGNKSEAFHLLEEYYIEYGSVENHYLINKVFGLLLYEAKQYEKAARFLSYAFGFMPDDSETLDAMISCFEKLGMHTEQKVAKEILILLDH